nr:Chain D, THR-LYS-ALA-ALA-ARG-MET-SER-ALA-PRO-SER [Homo sapiens]7TD5_I Chain I, THR-LYS-ALA-ALA-ARG-MET-SER-ALA-PRO-SER [Homo sapiens]
TKAARMSAPS